MQIVMNLLKQNQGNKLQNYLNNLLIPYSVGADHFY